MRYKFQDTPLLSGGVGVYETLHHVVVLVATVGSVHKMVFPHPERMHKQDVGYAATAGSVPSVLTEASSATPKQQCHIRPSAGTSPLPNIAGMPSVFFDDFSAILSKQLPKF